MTSGVDLQSVVQAAVQKALEDSAKATLPSDYLDAANLEAITGTPKATWRYWASIGEGPASFKLGRRRVWRRADFEQWIAEQEATSTSA